jgi:hypothetical protein
MKHLWTPFHTAQAVEWRRKGLEFSNKSNSNWLSFGSAAQRKFLESANKSK